MSSGTAARKNRVQFTKMSCYLCSEWLSDEMVEEHLQECSRALETCPEGCGLLVLRKDLAAHRNRCTDGFNEPPITSISLGNVLAAASAPEPCQTPSRGSNGSVTLDGDGVEALLHELRFVHRTLGEEVHYRANLLDRTVRLEQRLELANKWTIKVNDALVSVNKLVNGEIERRNAVMENLNERQKLLESSYQRTIITTDSTELPSPNGSRALEFSGETGAAAAMRPPDAAPPSLATRRWSAIAAGVLARSQLCGNPNDPVQQLVEQLIEEQTKTSCRVQEALQQTFDAAERLQRMEHQVERYRRETYYTKQRLDDLQTQLLHEANQRTLGATDGRIVWRIGDFEQRFVESQQHDIMMKGPLFTNQPFGYVLQLEVSLYGIGTWRGRNVLVGLTVLNGPNDPLLEWPCRLPGTVTLRDQPVNRAAARDINKSILAKRQSQHYTRQQFVYIPHDTLRSQHFIRDDAIFLEVVLDRTTEPPSTQALTPPPTSAGSSFT
ncbi:hypothetical protein AND_000023 [Anopheles darlingi]|uniref:MATH domain-containing protein n=1 Tax=Anopheles darlingi TaxID=43151 RepID=W5JX81_ANODA|nr:uncharacterized protein LOC125948867 [Anopheles darlingi]ETN68135.1 hypothetical protein AND_000023 [Anopheles darlingi]